jgi:hypothetical protein
LPWFRARRGRDRRTPDLREHHEARADGHVQQLRNTFCAAGASTFLAFLPMLPSQILLNNLMYDYLPTATQALVKLICRST